MCKNKDEIFKSLSQKTYTNSKSFVIMEGMLNPISIYKGVLVS